MLAFALTHGFDAFRAIVLGVIQGVTELFPISSLGHTVLLPKLFGWNELVAYQSSSTDNAWLAFLVMLHVGSAVGLLIYFWRDWVVIVKAFFATVRKRRIETTNERMAWLIIAASIPTGIIGIVLEHDARVATGTPEIAAIFLVINGLILFLAQWLTRRSEVRALASREGAKRDGGRKLETLEYREAGFLGIMQSGG